MRKGGDPDALFIRLVVSFVLYHFLVRLLKIMLEGSNKPGYYTDLYTLKGFCRVF